MRGSTILALVFIAVVITVALLSLSYPTVARFGPLLVVVPALALLLFQVLYENFSRQAKLQNSKAPAETAGVPARSKTTRRYMELVFWVAALLIPTYLVGIAIWFPLFTFAYAKRYGEGWLLAIALSAAVFAVAFGVFHKVLGIYLYKGVLLG